MGIDNFLYKTSVSFIIVSDEIDPDDISNDLMLKPDRSFKKGESSISKHSGSVVIKPHNLWEISSRTSVSEKETISPHIEYLKSILLPQNTILKKYKNDPSFETSFWIWIETDNAGIGIEFSETELSFLYTISNRVHLSFIAKT